MESLECKDPWLPYLALGNIVLLRTVRPLHRRGVVPHPVAVDRKGVSTGGAADRGERVPDQPRLRRRGPPKVRQRRGGAIDQKWKGGAKEERKGTRSGLNALLSIATIIIPQMFLRVHHLHRVILGKIKRKVKMVRAESLCNIDAVSCNAIPRHPDTTMLKPIIPSHVQKNGVWGNRKEVTMHHRSPPHNDICIQVATRIAIDELNEPLITHATIELADTAGVVLLHVPILTRTVKVLEHAHTELPPRTNFH